MIKRLTLETLLITALLSVFLCVPKTRSAVGPLDAYAYDRMLPLAATPVSPEILIVAIDEESLRQIGLWPWRRSVHAQLLNRLAESKPKAVFLDMYMPDVGNDDQELALAMIGVPTFLPLLRASVSQDGEVPEFGFLKPTAMLATHAKGIGHVELLPDQDGVARTLYLRQGPRKQLEPYIGLVMTGGIARGKNDRIIEKTNWTYRTPLHIAFAGTRGTYPTVSYIDVLKGKVSSDLIRGRIVLVGATAPGLGDQVLTPSVSTGGILSGIEVHANAIDNLLKNDSIRVWPDSLSCVWALVLLWTTAHFLLRFERDALPIAVFFSSIAIVVSAVGMTSQIWTSPVPPMLCIFVLYLVWSWRRLHSRFKHLHEGTQRLDRLPTVPFEFPSGKDESSVDLASSPSFALNRAAERLTQLQQLIGKAMSTMPVGILICDPSGDIHASNPAARSLLIKEIEGRENDEIEPLRGIALRAVLDAMESKRACTRAELEKKGPPPLTCLSGEYVMSDRIPVQLRVVPVSDDAHHSASGYVVTLVDLSDEREAERQREEWQRFLSHDLRSPQVNILSLLSLHEEGMEVPQMFDAIRRESERTLSLAEAFMDFSEAESGRYHFTETHIGALLMDIREQVSGYARRQGVAVNLNMADAEEVLLQADGRMLRRAIVNLINNAIRFSNPDSIVWVSAAVGPASQPDETTSLVISVSDDGAGMDEARKDELLKGSSFRSTTTPRHPDTQYGFGWEVVRAVVQRHSGVIDGVCSLGAGCTFWIVLPILKFDQIDMH